MSATVYGCSGYLILLSSRDLRRHNCPVCNRAYRDHDTLRCSCGTAWSVSAIQEFSGGSLATAKEKHLAFHAHSPVQHVLVSAAEAPTGQLHAVACSGGSAGEERG